MIPDETLQEKRSDKHSWHNLNINYTSGKYGIVGQKLRPTICAVTWGFVSKSIIRSNALSTLFSNTLSSILNRLDQTSFEFLTKFYFRVFSYF